MRKALAARLRPSAAVGGLRQKDADAAGSATRHDAPDPALAQPSEDAAVSAAASDPGLPQPAAPARERPGLLPGRSFSDTAPAAQGRRRLTAARELRRIDAVLAKTGDTLVSELLRSCDLPRAGEAASAEDLPAWSHLPPGDAYDPDSQSQYYFHAHPPEMSPSGEAGHFHTFLRVGPEAGEDGEGGVCHLVGVGVDQAGRAVRLFTVNRWVTGGLWRPAAEATALLDRFEVDLARPSWLVNRWITAVLRHYRPEIERLLEERDETLTRWRQRHPGEAVFDLRELEVTSSLTIDPAALYPSSRRRA